MSRREVQSAMKRNHDRVVKAHEARKRASERYHAELDRIQDACSHPKTYVAKGDDHARCVDCKKELEEG